MMMKMLEAGGLEVLTDQVRRADEDNPQGYYEFERVKQIEHDRSWLRDAEGKAVKMISQLLHHLPAEYTYQVVFMRREMEELLASQRKMLERRGEPASSVSEQKMSELFGKHLDRVLAWLRQRPNFDVLYVSYNRVLESPREQAEVINEFLREDLDVEAMAEVVDPALYRHRR